MEEDHWQSYRADVACQLGALWGKSAARAGGTSNLLLSHLLDTAAVAELVWDYYLSPVMRWRLDVIAGGNGRGRRFFAWLCGVHDCGKATPAFQSMDADGARRVRESGLSWDHYKVAGARWRHDKAGGRLVIEVLERAGWGSEHVEWVWPLVAGHHGVCPTRGQLRPPKADLQGRGPGWSEVQQALLMAFTYELGYDGEHPLSDVQPCQVPSRAVQLQLAGFIVMADWIASDERHFVGVDDLAKVGITAARERAARAWSALGLRRGWDRLALPGSDVFQARFDDDPRASQDLVLEIVRRMGGAGIVVVEAPMGEGKTKAALVAAEVLAARFGADGVFVGMPTQATSDPMFTQVRRWLRRIDEELESQVALLHGKRLFNKEWRELLEDAGEFGQEADGWFLSVDEDGLDEYGLRSAFGDGAGAPERRAPAEWFLGRLRGLLSPFAVGTIDQLLYGATRTRHVMLRSAGLAGKVVVLDEVHAADVYMSQFLLEGLWWLGQAGVPVVLLSATLPPAQRRDLVAAYLAGARSSEDRALPELPEPDGYPCVTAVWLNDQEPEFLVKSTTSWRDDLPVRVEILDEPVPTGTDRGREDGQGDADRAVAELLEDRLADGGCVLVIRNTVARAQTTYQELKKRFGRDVRLLHGRLHAAHRSDRTEKLLKLLGPPTSGEKRPRRLILVATQLAEQSFDVDADLLITDLAPIDLLLQRIGRLHRHDGVDRPQRLRTPTVVVTGMANRSGQVPWMLPASEAIYGRYLLLRTAALVAAAAGDTWDIPCQVPRLVAKVYGQDEDVVPAEWAEAEREAHEEWDSRQRRRAESAEPYLLTRRGEHESPTLEGLHYAAAQGSLGEEQFQALVRDGKRTLEVVLVHGADGFHTIAGRRLGPNGEVAAELVDEVLGGTVRLPAALTPAAKQELKPLPGWRDHPWLRHSLALVLDHQGATELGGHRVRYDDELGLVVDAPRGCW